MINMEAKTLKDVEKTTTKIERKARRTVKKIAPKFIFISVIAGIILALYLVTKFNNWSVTHKIRWQIPFRTPVWIEEVKPEKIKVPVIVTPTPTSAPRSEKEIIDSKKHAEVLWKIYGLESTWGKNDGCRLNGKGYGGFGVMNEGQVICYPTFEKAVERAEYWLISLGVDKDLATALCTWNTGVKQPNCHYYQSYLSL